MVTKGGSFAKDLIQNDLMDLNWELCELDCRLSCQGMRLVLTGGDMGGKGLVVILTNNICTDAAVWFLCAFRNCNRCTG